MSKINKKVAIIQVTDRSGEGEKELTIRKLPLGDYAELLLALSEIPRSLSGVFKMLFGDRTGAAEVVKGVQDEEGPEFAGTWGQGQQDQDQDQDQEFQPYHDPNQDDPLIEAMVQLPLIAANHWKDVVDVLAIASTLEKEDIQDLSLDEVAAVIESIFQVNDFFGARDRLAGIQFNYLLKNKQLARAAVKSSSGKK